jgi:trk system potassium uptake protein TrkA
MKIIIVGDGEVGYALSEHLSREGHDITIIDNKTQALKKFVNALEVFTIKGNGTSLDSMFFLYL